MPRPPLPEFQDKFVAQDVVSEVTGISEPALAQDRCTGTLGIPYHKFGSRVRYRLSEVIRWAEQRRVVPRRVPSACQREAALALEGSDLSERRLT